MDPEVEARFERSEASFNRRMLRAERAADQRAKKAEAWGIRFDRRLAANYRQFALLFGSAPDKFRGPTPKIDALTRKLDKMLKTEKVILKLVQKRYGHGSY
jgi:hypothetical protein